MTIAQVHSGPLQVSGITCLGFNEPPCLLLPNWYDDGALALRLPLLMVLLVFASNTGLGPARRLLAQGGK